MKITTLPYFGKINAIISQENISLLTVKAETTLYKLDSKTEHPTLASHTLPVAMDGLCALPDSTVAMIGRDGHLYQTDWHTSKVSQISKQSIFEQRKTEQNLDNAIAISAFGDNIAILYPNYLCVFRYQKHKLGECWVNLPLNSSFADDKTIQTATSLAVSADGEWLVIGDNDGFVSSFYANAERTELLFSSQEQLHEGAVTSLCFEPIAQQFFSAGVDKKLLRTHAQGKLQGIDRAKNSQHSEMIRTMLVVGERLYTGADDKSIKSWQFDKGQPNTCKEDLTKVQFLSHCHYQQQPSILAVSTDQSLRFVPLDNDGKVSQVSHIIKNGYQRLKDLLSNTDNQIFAEGLALLNEKGDNERLALAAEILHKANFSQRGEALVTWIANHTSLNKAVSQLEQCISKHPVEKVREIAFNALQNCKTANPLHYLQLALDSKFLDMNKRAIDAYVDLAKQNATFFAQVMPILEKSLNHREVEIQVKSLQALENLLPKDSPKADLMALSSESLDIKAVGLTRLYQRNFLQNFEVKRQLMLLQHDNEGKVRATAFYISILAEPALADVVINLDENFARLVQGLDSFSFDNLHNSELPKAKKSKKTVKHGLTDDELEPLLQGLSNPFGGISVTSAYLLSLLQDKRAFGVLTRLINDDKDVVRLEVAKAFGELHLVDNLTVLSALLDDKAENVRQTAMQSYGKIVKSLKLPILRWVQAGFNSQHQDIHQQALSVLLQEFNAESIDFASFTNILQQALNNPFETIRQEVVKVLINRFAQSSNVSLFNLLKQSQYADVHQVALDEWHALLRQNSEQDKAKIEQWLGEFLNSDFDSIRQSAFNIAKSQPKRIELKTLLSLAITSSAVSMRKQALALLDNKKSPELLPLIANLFDDENHELRLLALNLALEASDVVLLQQALQSPYDDIQLATATALAKQGDKQSFAIFEYFLNKPVPQLANDIKQWSTNVEKSLLGMAQLKDERGFEWFIKFLLDSNYTFANNLALTSQLYWVTRPEHLPTLRQLQTHDNKNIRQAVNLALCVWGDTSGDMILQSHKSSALKTKELLVAPIGLGMPSAKMMARFINNNETKLTSQFLLTVYDVLQNPEQPKRLIESLSFVDNVSALFFADVLSHYADKDKVWQTLVDKINETMHQTTYYLTHNDKNAKNWAITADDVQLLANGAVFGSPLLKASVVELLQLWEEKSSFNNWQSYLQVFKNLHQTAIHDLPKPQKTPDVKAQEYGWQAVAFGAYVGVLRDGGYGNDIAITALTNFAKTYPTWQNSVQQVLLSMLNHDTYYMRHRSLASLVELQVPSLMLAEQAINSPYEEIIKQGLEILQKILTKQQLDEKLPEFLQTSSPILAEKTYQMLVTQQGLLQAGKLALQSSSLALRHQVTASWAQVQNSEQLQEKLAFLTLASNNSDWQTRHIAIDLLFSMDYQSMWLDKAIELWQSASDINEQELITAMLYRFSVVIGKQADDCLKVLSLLDNPHRKVALLPIYDILAHSRNVALVQPLLARFVEKPQERNPIYKTLLTISGFDQPIIDYQDELADKSWLEKQHPRHVAVLLQLAEKLIKTTDYKYFIELLKPLAWANDEQFNVKIDDLLQKAYRQLPSKYTADIVKAMSYQAEKRQADLAGLRLALSNKDAMIQFLSAEGLAKRGNKEGFAILMASIDYQTDGDLRRRAVLALGELGDEGAFDKLLKLANDSEHYLQDVASEALGHLGNTEHGQRIFAMLSSQLEKFEDDNPAIEHIINGLRWLDTFDSWQQIRNFISKSQTPQYEYAFWSSSEHAVKTLRYHTKDDDILKANQDFILKILRTYKDDNMVEMAFDTAKALFGNDKQTIYPYDWAVLLGVYPTVNDNLSLERVSKFANFDELLNHTEQFPNAIVYRKYNQVTDFFDEQDDKLVLQTLNQTILQRPNMAGERLEKLLLTDNSHSRQLGLSYLSQYPTDYWSKDLEKILWQQLHDKQQDFVTLQTKWQAQPDLSNTQQGKQFANQLIVNVEKLLWLLGRFSKHDKANQQKIADSLTWLIDQQKLLINQNIAQLNSALHTWIKQLLLALLARPADDFAKTNEWQAVLTNVKEWSDIGLQQLAEKLLQRLPNQASVLQKITNVVQKVIGNHASLQNPQHQLINWVQQGNLSALANWATDSKLDENLRMSAIEGLGQLPLSMADDVIAQLSNLQKQDKDSDIKQSAFKALRRYQRRLIPKNKTYADNDTHNI